MSIKATMSPSGRSRHFKRAQTTSGSLIGRLGSSAFTLSITTVSMSLTGSCFSSESAPRPLYRAFLVKKFLCRAAHHFRYGAAWAVGMTIRGEPAFGRGSIAPQPCIR